VSNKTVKILDGMPSKKGAYLKQLYDPDTGRYFVPMFPQHPFFENIKNKAKLVLKKRLGLKMRGVRPPDMKVAIVDTGLMLNHPWIKRSLEDSIDLTGEGPEDLNGHGTLMALLFLAVLYPVPNPINPYARLLNVKVMDAEGRGRERDLIKGIRWSVKKGAGMINLSVGVYHKKWGLWECKGDCKVCKAAAQTAEANVTVVAAAGNEPNKTCCPAKVGVAKKDSGVRSVAAYDLGRQTIAPYSGIGNIAAPAEYKVKFIEIPPDKTII